MNDLERRGRALVLLVGLGLIGSAVLDLLGSMMLHARGSIGIAGARLAICTVFALLMWQGYSWARSYIAFLLVVGAGLGALASVIALFRTPLGLVGLVFAAFYAWGGWVLWKSPLVDAYIEFRERLRNPDMSFGSGSSR